jgi:hypothetical protein
LTKEGRVNRLTIATAAALSVALVGAASAQTVKGGANGLKGKIVTGSCTAAPGLSCTILSAPEKGALVITTGCLTGANPSGFYGFVLNGQPLHQDCLTSDEVSNTLPVGYVVAPGSDLECANPASSTLPVVCTASGILTKK